MCHPIDDCRSPVADDAEMGIEVYTEFVNNYFGRLDSFDYLHTQLYKKNGNAEQLMLLRWVYYWAEKTGMRVVASMDSC
ncbi:hypothetical protein C5167_005472 [Papaver somniferum]|uniref:Uncharacterized protein n=1 Tax=Papaver somniferum TaxID=3469 RepID=A0A4Y7JDT7_PAPSO|nr:hypothetical protein C5167_005472 [Papaver somniferum]